MSKDGIWKEWDDRMKLPSLVSRVMSIMGIWASSGPVVPGSCERLGVPRPCTAGDDTNKHTSHRSAAAPFPPQWPPTDQPSVE
jgi:hypothetical protein